MTNRRLHLGAALAILLVLGLGSVLVRAESTITIGFLPAQTLEESILLRGSAPRGSTVIVLVNGQEQTRVWANATMDVYQALIHLEVGQNRIQARLEQGAAAEARILRRPVPFADLKGHWSRDDVTDLVEAGIVSGYGDGRFGPDEGLTRAQFAKMVVLALGLEPKDGARLSFADAAATPEWAVGYIAVAVEQGLIMGHDDNHFRPDDPVTRAQVAVIASRGLKKKGHTPKGQGQEFLDNDQIPAWAAADVDRVAKAGLFGSFWGYRFLPAQPATRAEAAAVVLRLMRAKGE